MAKWEYKVLEYEVKGGFFSRMHIKEDYATVLSGHGHEGWELVGIIPFTENQGRLTKVHFILKRPE